MGAPVDPKQFWEQKILGWEDGRYHKVETTSWFEGLADRASMSLRFRLRVAVRLLAPLIQGKRIVELGCGSALLAEEFLELGAASYLGYDFAEVAIERGRERLAASGLADRASLEVGDVAGLRPFEADVVLSLGLFDWLSLEEIDHIFACSGGAAFLHAIAERRFSLQQWIHRAYVHLSYGRRTGSYRPKYFSVTEIGEIARRHGIPETYAFRHHKLSFGALLTSFPVPRDLG